MSAGAMLRRRTQASGLVYGTETFTGLAASSGRAPAPWLAQTYPPASQAAAAAGAKWSMVGTVGYIGTAMTYGYATWTDLDVSWDLTINATIQEHYPALGYRMSGGVYGFNTPGCYPWNGYAVWLQVNGNLLNFAPFTNGVQGTATTAAFTFTGGATYRCRLQVTGSTHNFAVWPVAGAQSGWQLTVTNATYTSGLWGFMDQANLATTSTWDNFQWLPATGSGTGYTGPIFTNAGALASNVIGITVPWPSGHQVNDVGLLVLESCGGEVPTLTTANGFVEVTGSPSFTGTTTLGTRLTCYWCRATSTAMASPVVSDPGDHVEGVILGFRGCITSGNPWDVTAAAQKATASTAMSMPAVTTTGTDRLIVNLATRDTDLATASASAWANAGLVNLHEVFDLGTTSGNGGGIMVATGEKATAGSTGSTTATVLSSINAYLTLALKAA